VVVLAGVTTHGQVVDEGESWIFADAVATHDGPGQGIGWIGWTRPGVELNSAGLCADDAPADPRRLGMQKIGRVTNVVDSSKKAAATMKQFSLFEAGNTWGNSSEGRRPARVVAFGWIRQRRILEAVQSFQSSHSYWVQGLRQAFASAADAQPARAAFRSLVGRSTQH
jgi:hypothetical protein